MDKKKIALIVVVLFLLIGLGSFVFANPDQDNSLEGPGVSEDGGSGDGEAIDGTTPTATPTEEGNGQTTLGTNPVTTIGNGGTGTGTNGSDSTEVTGGIGNTEMSAYEDAAKIVAELENKVASMTNRDESNAAIDYRTDTDIMNIVNGLPDGEEKDQLLDRLAAINKVLDDTKKPEISGISNGDITKENVTINVTDDNDVVITATLDGEAIDFTTPLTEEGKYVVIVTDKNFNESKVEFTIDKHAPTRQVLRLTNISQKDANENYLQIAKAGDTVRVIVQFDEELATLPTLKVNGVEVGQMKYDSNMSSYTFDYHVTENDVNGIMQIEISNYADAAGNVGGVLTNAEINHDTQNQMIIDTVAPVLNFNNGFITDGFTVVATDVNFDYMTIQFYDGREMVTTNENTFTLDKDGDNTRYNIKAYDKAGNVSVYADIYLDTQKPVITGTGKNGKNDVNVANNGYYKNVTLHIEDGSMKKVVLVHSDNTEEVLQEYKDNYTTDKMIFDRAFTEDGTYTIKAVDRFGHESTITFTIDTVKPIITGIENGTFTNQDVTLNVTDENPGGTIHLKRDGQIVKNYSFGTPLTEEGTYEVYVSDLAGNVSDTLTFTIDKTAPEFHPTYWTKTVEADKNATFTDLPGVYGTDNAEGTVNVEIVNNTVNMGVPGEYKLQYVTTDAAGNKAYNDIFITVVDTTAPEFHPTYWTKTVEADKNATFTDLPGVYGTDNAEGTVNVEIVNNTVNMGVPGEYKLQYVTTDAAGNKAYNDIFITVVDTTAPVVTLIDGDMTIEVNTPFQDPGVIITDNSNEELTADLTVYYSVDGADGTWVAAKDNKVDNTVLGHYAVWYSAKDSSGNVSNSVRRYVVVVDTTAPAVTLVDGDMTIEVNTPFQDPGVIITDNSNEELTADLTVYYSVDGADGTWVAAKDNKVDNTALGHYAVWYSAKDSSGNVSNSVRRYVVVVDTTAPVFDLSAIPTTFTIGEDIYKYPQAGKVTDNYDGTISFSKVHMNWYHKNSDGSKGEATKCFAGDNWNTSLTSCEPGDYIITYRVSDKTGNVASEEKTITLVEKKENQAPVVNVIYNYGTPLEYSEPIESGKTYKGVVLSFADDSGSFTLYYDQDNGYTNKATLVQNTLAHKVTDATIDNPYKWNRGASKGLSIYIVDNEGKSLFIKNVIIEK